MIDPINNSYNNSAAALIDNNKAGSATDKQGAPAEPKIAISQVDTQDMTIKDQLKDLASSGPPVDKSLVQEIKSKVEQGIYPIDLDLVTEKMFESFEESLG
jgi:flagellar biosynthesis anti-sigma factor FlgM